MEKEFIPFGPKWKRCMMRMKISDIEGIFEIKNTYKDKSAFIDKIAEISKQRLINENN